MPGFVGAHRATTAQRGYDSLHQRRRRAAFNALPEYTPCARCGQQMWKWQTEPIGRTGRTRSALHYDHNGARTGYLGFSCADCNRKAGASAGGKIVAQRQQRRTRPRPAGQPWHSRTWL
ncbi:MAG TPA: hypothetical protein VFW64_12190 [Pseudonocardiaceae bacterium]|nr:hypothetical protein [Pseudonocardiaceae bacterium]